MSRAEIGVIFPTRDIAAQPADVLGFGPLVEELGADFVSTYDHIVGAPAEKLDTSETDCIFDSSTNVHEALIVLTAMAARTERIRLVTSCLVTPQRQTALVAKQAAELDIISNGRLDLGVSIGWNQLEFEALGADFNNRVLRLEDQIASLRNFWSGQTNTADRTHPETFEVSIEPKPIQQPIPIWIGGMSLNAAYRAAATADGWLPLGYIDQTMQQKAERFWERAYKNGRNDLKLMGRINPWSDSDEQCIDQYGQWLEAGATHVAVGTSQGCYKSAEPYADELGSFLEILATT